MGDVTHPEDASLLTLETATVVMKVTPAPWLGMHYHDQQSTDVIIIASHVTSTFVYSSLIKRTDQELKNQPFIKFFLFVKL